jgi:hypothetical protein
MGRAATNVYSTDFLVRGQNSDSESDTDVLADVTLFSFFLLVFLRVARPSKE